MKFLDALMTLLRWKDQGWDVHPLIDADEFGGWL